eukprot:2619553-Amphidinium_carterae.1
MAYPSPSTHPIWLAAITSLGCTHCGDLWIAETIIPSALLALKMSRAFAIGFCNYNWTCVGA